MLPFRKKEAIQQQPFATCGGGFYRVLRLANNCDRIPTSAFEVFLEDTVTDNRVIRIVHKENYMRRLWVLR